MSLFLVPPPLLFPWSPLSLPDTPPPLRFRKRAEAKPKGFKKIASRPMEGYNIAGEGGCMDVGDGAFPRRRLQVVDVTGGQRSCEGEAGRRRR